MSRYSGEKSVQEATYDALSLRTYIIRTRLRDYGKSWDFQAALIGGIIINICAEFLPRHGMISGYFTLIVSTFAIVGGFFGTSLSILIGLLPRPIAARDRIQYLNVICDFCFSVAAIFAIVIGWIAYVSFYTVSTDFARTLRQIARAFLIFVTCYGALLPFSAVQRLFRISGAVTIAEETSTKEF